MTDRLTRLLETHGEVMSRAEAAKVLSVCRTTLLSLIKAGKIKTACEGKRIDTVSVARYIDSTIK
ncbi:MAG: helix-turn-helix domain-containing protein [Lachnospiraceae bacterium]|nr:helix-turn-helix domain-containing protein [Lachnospiraceae bacterium]